MQQALPEGALRGGNSSSNSRDTCSARVGVLAAPSPHAPLSMWWEQSRGTCTTAHITQRLWHAQGSETRMPQALSAWRLFCSKLHCLHVERTAWRQATAVVVTREGLYAACASSVTYHGHQGVLVHLVHQLVVAHHLNKRHLPDKKVVDVTHSWCFQHFEPNSTKISDWARRRYKPELLSVAAPHQEKLGLSGGSTV